MNVEKRDFHGNHLAIGLMSGTSADGIDAALIQTNGITSPQSIATVFSPYPQPLRRDLLEMCEPQVRGSSVDSVDLIDKLGEMDRLLGEAFAQTAMELCHQAALSPEKITVIGSHGQTIRHRPRRFSLQIGNPAIISARTGITTISNFRATDIAHGGEGAPLTPLFHQALFGEHGKRVAVINLGGIANITALPSESGKPVIAGDSGPANILLDLLSVRESSGKKSCDQNGEQASRGQVHTKALRWLWQHPYCQQTFPKSTGRESFGETFLEQFLRNFPTLSIEDHFATLAQFTAETVVNTCQKALPPHPDKAILCGGGIHNLDLRARIDAALPETTVITSSESGISADFLEAQAFAWFAVRTLQGITSSLPSATGAHQAAVLGAINRTSP